MFEVAKGPQGEFVFRGRLDASQVERAREALGELKGSGVVDFKGLDYISSAGMGVLLGVQKKLSGSGHSLTLVNLNSHIREIFRIAGFDRVFKIE